MLNTTSYMSLSWEKAVQWARETPAMQGLVEICYYDDPIEAAAERFLRSEEWPAILSLLRIEPGDQVLEIGGGRGIISWALAKAGCEVTVLEPDPSPLVGSGAIRSLCQATSVPLTIVEDWGERLPFAEMQFDKVICRAVLHHARDLPDMCREIHRVLCPGGRFLAIKDHVVDDTTQLEQFLLNHPLHYLYGGEHAFIGNYVLISHGVTILDNNGHSMLWDERRDELEAILPNFPSYEHHHDLRAAPITIEDYAWIGFGASILPGVRIGQAAVVGAMTVVTKDVAPHSVVIGNPQRIIHAHP